MQVLSILGPTALGKSRIAVTVAEQLKGEIVSCDSMMVYRGMNIGTAKPGVAVRERVPHHMIDIVDIGCRFTAKLFVDRARDAIADIRHRGKLPILCGGTGMYVKALLEQYHFAPHDPDIAAEIRTVYSSDDVAGLHDALEKLDSDEAHRATNNPRRLMRALETARIEPTCCARSPDRAGAPDLSGPQFIFIPAPALLAHRIDMRVRTMISAGWIDEVAALLHKGLLDAPTASQALGYRQIAAFIQDGREDVEALIDEIARRTRAYAKRQRTWFRHQHPGAEVMELHEAWNEEDLAARIVRSATV